ncbi:DUF2059 domain-containing protein [Magnetofaba australis]|uniref:DUF2059 domain-containing protein n=1 Tax=Magnetofaba australis IT-1 TaxID=1434232 RepID=A0A1Y2K6K5_9PROT|nr:DUF2059 domain-containing protein [Magnetofaba australis]OSM03982.1 hypothetical protein MAIT1_03769 [Magnetofaba australis IT-1]
MLKKLSLFLVITLLLGAQLPTSAQAGDAQAIPPEAHELAALTYTRAQFEQIMTTMTTIMTRSMKPLVTRLVKKELPNAAPQKVAGIAGRIQEKASEEIIQLFKANYDDFLTMATGLMTKHYTPNEMREIVAFLKTPTGAKMIRTAPVMMQEGAVMGQMWAQKHLKGRAGPIVQKHLTAQLKQAETTVIQ